MGRRKGSKNLSKEAIDKIKQDWLMFPDLTTTQLANMHNVSFKALQRIVKGLNRRTQSKHAELSIDVLESSGVQIDTTGKVLGMKKRVFYSPVDSLPHESEPETFKIVKCPHCPSRMTPRQLLKHCIGKHRRYDLEYLLD